MTRIRFFTLAAGFLALSAAIVPAYGQGAGQWSTVKGQVVFPAGAPVPARAALNITQDKNHCLEKGPILAEDVIVNPKNKGIANVVVWLRPDTDNPKAAFPKDKINPADASRKPVEVSIDQPCCMFTPRVTTARVGDSLAVKNSAPVPHNFMFSSANNGEFNVAIPPKGQHKLPKPLVAENTPISYKCSIHPWMNGWVRIFEHPYYAVTDADGKFELKDAPAGKWKLVVWHEAKGFLGGRDGRLGQPIEITGPTMEMKPITFDVSAK